MIVDHPTLKFTPSHERWYESAKVVKCDFCSTLAKGTGEDAGAAADRARKEGFITVRGDTVADPRKWCCPKCRDNPKR